MRIIRYVYRKKECWGGIPPGSDRIIPGGIPLSRVRLLAPALPTKVVLAGLNFRRHAVEMKLPVPKQPVIFMKPLTALIGPGETIVYPRWVGRLDYEAELALVIGKTARNIPERKARGYILGYTCLNDVTARDLQKKDGQWTRAKSFDTFCPIGPWIETSFDPSRARIRAILNGRVMQDAPTADFIFPPSYMVSFVSRVMTLYPGDVISMGTPGGVGRMKTGDSIAVEIEGIGRLENRVA
ncbi:MAG: fumarylacetoacetate hydrolase family protein [Deltaproteobacteria bacterium]